MPHKTNQPTGLGNTPYNEFPKLKPGEVAQPPIDRLIPRSELHTRVLEYLKSRLDLSERHMQQFYDRWRFNERRLQAYVDLPAYDQMIKDMNDSSKPPVATQIVVPYSWATISTIVTYLIHTFTGRRPMFSIQAMEGGSVDAARAMEQLLQYNADVSKLIDDLFQVFQDGQVYGVGIILNHWKTETALRTVWRESPAFSPFGNPQGTTKTKVRERRIVYEGNITEPVDPFMFFPDPNVPMAKVNVQGEFVFWRRFFGKHKMKQMQAQGMFKWVDAVGSQVPNTYSTQSDRNLLSGGNENPGDFRSNQYGQGEDYVQIDQGTIEIIPAELGLGESLIPEKWIFTIANKTQIVQAQPFEADHGMHPVSVAEPYAMGYSFGNPGLSDFIGPMQDMISWFLNSHMLNVRSSMNNMFVYDPSMIEKQDLLRPGPGKLIRLKASAFGMDVRQALQQLQVQDVTSGNIDSMTQVARIADQMSAVTDNLRGIQAAGGRKTATEVRTSGEASASRLAALAKRWSTQAIVDMTKQQSLNIQQFMSREALVQVLGNDGSQNMIRVGPEHVVGDFHYPVNDGTLPTDRVALLDVWKEIYLGISSNPQLAQGYDLGKIFEYIAELGGAKNIDKFRIAIQPDEQVDQQAQAGNIVPIPQTRGSGPAAGLEGNPAGRIIGG